MAKDTYPSRYETPKTADKEIQKPQVPAFKPGKPPRFWLESTVYPRGGTQYKSADPFEGQIAMAKFPAIAYHGQRLFINGEARIDDPQVIVKLLGLGGHLRYDAQEIIDSGLIPFSQVVELLGPNPIFWENGPTGVMKIRRQLVNRQSGDISDVDGEPDVPIKRIQMMDLDELRELADMFGIYLPAKIGIVKARTDFMTAFEKLDGDAKKAGQEKWNAKAKGRARA